MSVRQVTISVTTEGVGDLYVLPPLVERATFEVLRRETHLDVDVLAPLQSRRPSGASFEAWMSHVERQHGADLFVVHQDADRHGTSDVLGGRWASWLERAAEPRRWVIAVPVPTTEAWMMADHESLASVLAMPHRSVLERTGRSARADSVRGPKRVVADLVERSQGVHGWTIRFGPMASAWAARASLARLAQRSVSYADFTRRLSQSLRATLLGGSET